MVRRTKENLRIGRRLEGKIKGRTVIRDTEESWLNRKWRPAMGWMYMVVCIADFIVFPIAWALFQAYIGASPVKPHEPFTLQGAGLFHMAMGAVLGIAAWSRGKEKIAGVTGSRYIEEYDDSGDEDYGYNNSRNNNRYQENREYESYQSLGSSKKSPPPAEDPLI